TNTWESIQHNVTTIGEIFGKEKEAQEELANLATMIDETKEKAEASNLKALTLLINEGSLSAYGAGSRFSILHDNFGFAQADENIEASTHGQNVSYEYVLKNNPDLIFVIDRTKAIGGDTSQNSLVENELVQQTTAGENDQVVSLDPQVWYLAGSGIESLKLMIEDVNQAFK
ncbi:MAG: ABC transporter substrate-binding protein, partial [Enterococcus aquimarinus]